MERGIARPCVLSEVKPYLKSGRVNEAWILAVAKAAAAERDREENFSSKSKKVKGQSVKLQLVQLRQAKLKILLWGSLLICLKSLIRGLPVWKVDLMP